VIAATASAHRPLRLLFQDEARFGRIHDGRRCWAPLPLRPIVGHQVVREFVYAFVAVSPHDGQMASLVLPWVDTELMGLFLAHVASLFPDDHCVMLMDGAGWHTANALPVPAHMTLLPLPPYSPELNPVEQVWKYTRTNDLRNQTFDSLDDVVAVVSSSLHTLHTHPDLVRSITNYDWIQTLPLM
jgi:hypothetical protein